MCTGHGSGILFFFLAEEAEGRAKKERQASPLGHLKEAFVITLGGHCSTAGIQWASNVTRDDRTVSIDAVKNESASAPSAAPRRKIVRKESRAAFSANYLGTRCRGGRRKLKGCTMVASRAN